MTPTTVTRTPALRLVPAPAVDPPYDDEVAAEPPRVKGNLALAFPPPTSNPLPLRLVPPAYRPPAAPDASAPLPDAGPWVRRLAQAIVEVLAGARTAAQLSAFASIGVLEELEWAAGRALRSPRPGTPTRRPMVSSVHVCRPCPAVVEACAVVDTGERRRALALRLEGHDGRWQCTALQLG